jgi:hypothetical protein
MDTQLYSLAQIRAIEAAAQAASSRRTLMRAPARPPRPTRWNCWAASRRARCWCWPGRATTAATRSRWPPTWPTWASRSRCAPGRQRALAEAQRALERARASRARFVDEVPPDRDWCLVVDGLFGIGLARPLAGRARELAALTCAWRCPVLALDVPSGLDADTGAVVGPDGAAVCATHTITFIGNKPGLHTGDGCDHAGRVHVDRLGSAACTAKPRMRA